MSIDHSTMTLQDNPMPGNLNIVLFFCATFISIGALLLATHADSILITISCVIIFALTNNTMFSLLHEAVHNIFHTNTHINNIFGRLASLFFPTSFTLQRTFHLSHHRNNRSELEQFDYIREGDNLFIKNAQWYCILTGAYWLFIPAGNIIYLLYPSFYSNGLTKLVGSKLVEQTGAKSLFNEIKQLPHKIVRLEIILFISFHSLLLLALKIDLTIYLMSYGLFAFMWSSLQYADHAFSPLDTRTGAWNLKVPNILRWFFLNYHNHLVHHQHPALPWLYLHKYALNYKDQPYFMDIYLEMWKGPKPINSNKHYAKI